MNNFRGISLMSIAAKVFNRVILNRIYDEISKILRPFRAGFRKKKSCTEQIHIIRRIIEQYHQKNKPIVMTFIDFKKAFDSIDREIMWKILRHYGIPEKIVTLIKCLYNGSTSSVRVNGILSKEFAVSTGVLQGDTLAPFLFVIVLDFVMRHTPATLGLQKIYGNTLLPDLDFADDIVLLDKNEIEAIEHFEMIESFAEEVGLKVNYDKTKIMTRNIENSRAEESNNILVMKLSEDKKLEVVDDFKYLGAYIANCHQDLKRRKGIAWSQFWKLITIWKSSEISLQLKLHLFDSLIISIFFYGAETWSLTKVMKKEIDAFGTNCYRYMLGIRRIDRVRNEEILQRVKRNNLSDQLFKRQLKAIGHWIRKDDIIARYALYQHNNGKNRRGRPRITYNKHIEDITGKTIEELQTTAMDRDEWRRDVVGRFDIRSPD